jgi:predicted RNA-binding protein with PUA-like domain
VVVEIVPKTALKNPVSLEQVKTEKSLSTMCLIKKQRLSVAPVTEKEWERVIEMAR